MSAIIEIEQTHVTASGPRYRVWHAGSVLIESCRVPICDASRLLSERGVTGRLQMRRKGSSRLDMEGLIAVLATKTVTESQVSSPRFAKWSPHWASEEAAQ